ncbi:MAG: sensor histidine kinase, partial [Chitinophagales bacterium]
AYEFLQKKTKLKEEIMGSKAKQAINLLERKVESERKEKEKIASEIKALRAQINPHFIFNTLNSIQNYIAHNQSEDAQRFLASFASLMRQTLENSDEALVRVEDEVYFIQTYLTLEQLRFEQKFDFSIKIGEDVDIEALLMPPMLLQPYFENAILHGIQPKEGKGLIGLELIEQEENLHFIITDNGIGRSATIQKKKPQHKSMGTQIQADRLKALNSFYKKPIEVQTTDITDKLGKICGTKVELKIPIWEV